MKQGEAAVKRLAEIDSSTGLQDPVDVARRMRRDQQAPLQAAQGALGDDQIANNMRIQAERMATEAKGLLAESERMMKEANQMLGVSVEKKTTRKAKAAVVAPVEQPKAVVKTRVKKPKVEA
jgi:hypothetical protein